MPERTDQSSEGCKSSIKITRHYTDPRQKKITGCAVDCFASVYFYSPCCRHTYKLVYNAEKVDNPAHDWQDDNSNNDKNKKKIKKNNYKILTLES